MKARHSSALKFIFYQFLSLRAQYTNALLGFGKMLLDVSKILHSTGSIRNVMLRQNKSPIDLCFVPTFNGLRLQHKPFDIISGIVNDMVKRRFFARDGVVVQIGEELFILELRWHFSNRRLKSKTRPSEITVCTQSLSHSRRMLWRNSASITFLSSTRSNSSSCGRISSFPSE